MKNVLGILAAILFIIVLAYGNWQIERWWNYKFGYQSQVQAKLVPLQKQIADLQLRVSVLETNKQR